MARFEGLDILGAFQVGNQIRNSRQANAREDANLQRLYEQDAAQAAAEEQRQAIALEGRRLDLQNNKAKARTENTAIWQKRAANALALKPENHRQIRQQIAAMVQAGHIDPFEIPGGDGPNDVGPPVDVVPTQDEVGQFAAMAGVEPKEDPYGKPTTDMINYRAERDDPGFAKRQAEERKGKGTTVNNVMPGGGVGLSNAASTATQAEIEAVDMREQKLDELDAALEAVGGSEAYAQLSNATEADIGNLASRLGFKTNTDMLKARARVDAAIGEFSNQVISDRGGANVPPDELKRLTRSLMDTVDSAPQLDAKRASWRRSNAQLRDRGVGKLKHGIKEKPPDGRIRVQLENGKTATLPAEQVEAYVKQNPKTKVLK